MRCASFLLGVFLSWVVMGGELYPPMQPPFTAIVRDGEPRAKIVVCEESARPPAGEFATYIERISGARFNIVTDCSVNNYNIFIGSERAVESAKESGVPIEKSLLDSLGDDGYLIKATERGLLLAGKTQLSVYYAVYAFLEKYLGVRWFLACPLGEVVPNKKTIEVGTIEDISKPAFVLRWVGRGDWARRNGMNVAVGAEGELKIKWFVHTFTRLLPPEKYYAEHPEYFALIGGEGNQAHPARSDSNLHLQPRCNQGGCRQCAQVEGARPHAFHHLR